jgi:hypothetical protein
MLIIGFRWLMVRSFVEILNLLLPLMSRELFEFKFEMDRKLIEGADYLYNSVNYIRMGGKDY